VEDPLRHRADLPPIRPHNWVTRVVEAPNSDGYGGGWAIANSYRPLHTWQVASLGLNSGMSR
jgi:hypothetical protein